LTKSFKETSTCAGDRHPVVYVSSLDAIKFCQSLSTRERKRYRLPTEAEWEYAARGMDARIYPWGNHGGRGDLANFADRNTVFAWSDRDVDDGHGREFTRLAPIHSGLARLAMEDMAGNVWECASDYLLHTGGLLRRTARSGKRCQACLSRWQLEVPL
jgi:formylglycine-generating enzyme required for sulfatase activity